MQKWFDSNGERIVRPKGTIKYDYPLRFIPLNKCKPGNHAHHIYRDHVIFIPMKMHNSVYHDLAKGINMDIINDLAMKYLNSKEGCKNAE